MVAGFQDMISRTILLIKYWITSIALKNPLVKPMTVTRRGFLRGLLALAAAPAITKADNLMRVVPVKAEIVLPASFTFRLDGLTPNQLYTNSFWVKRPNGGVWERIQTQFVAPLTGTVDVEVPTHGEPIIQVWGNQLESQGHMGGLITPKLQLQNTMIQLDRTPFDEGERCGMFHFHKLSDPMKSRKEWNYARTLNSTH